MTFFDAFNRYGSKYISYIEVHLTTFYYYCKRLNFLNIEAFNARLSIILQLIYGRKEIYEHGQEIKSGFIPFENNFQTEFSRSNRT